MAKIAIIKVFTGLNLAPAQLSAELQAAGHDSRIIYFKDYVPKDEKELGNGDFIVPVDAGWLTVSGRERRAWATYEPFLDVEYEQLIKVLEEFDPDVIGMSVYSAIIDESGGVANRIKQAFPDKPVLWGGPGPTLSPERCAEYADILCINEGEEFLVELANKIDAGEDYRDIAGGWFKMDDGSWNKTPGRPLIDIKKLAFPDWEEERYVHITKDKTTYGSYPWNLMATVHYSKEFSGKQYVIMTQRGCPFSCSFCIESKYQDMFGKKDSLRRRDVDQVLEELRYAKNVMKVVSIWFYDDVFTVNPRWLKEFLPRYKEEIGLPFWCYTYPTTHTPETLRLLKEAGCDSITMGVQSGSERVLREAYNRPTKISRVLEAADEIVDSGLIGTIDMLTKSEFETLQDLEDTFQFMLALNPKIKCWVFGEVSSYPSYDYTQKRNEIGVDVLAGTMPTPNDYDFYHKLYRLTRTKCPRDLLQDFPRDSQARLEKQGELDELLDRWHLGRNMQIKKVDDKNSGHLDVKGDGLRAKGATF